MLPRIRAALTQFISPIASSVSKQTQNNTQSNVFKRFTRDSKTEKNAQTNSSSPVTPTQPKADSHQSQPKLRLVKPPQDGDETEQESTTGNPNLPAVAGALGQRPGSTQSVTSAFLQLFSMLQNKTDTLKTWIGTQSYLKSSRGQKKTGKFRKGTVLDEKAE